MTRNEIARLATRQVLTTEDLEHFDWATPQQSRFLLELLLETGLLHLYPKHLYGEDTQFLDATTQKALLTDSYAISPNTLGSNELPARIASARGVISDEFQENRHIAILIAEELIRPALAHRTEDKLPLVLKEYLNERLYKATKHPMLGHPSQWGHTDILLQTNRIELLAKEPQRLLLTHARGSLIAYGRPHLIDWHNLQSLQQKNLIAQAIIEGTLHLLDFNGFADALTTDYKGTTLLQVVFEKNLTAQLDPQLVVPAYSQFIQRVLPTLKPETSEAQAWIIELAKCTLTNRKKSGPLSVASCGRTPAT